MAVNLIFYVAPLRQIRIALRELDTSRVPVALSVLQFLGATTWAINGVLMTDTFILIPNSFGSVMGALQLGLLAYIRHRAKGQRAGNTPQSPSTTQTQTPPAASGEEEGAEVAGKGGLAAADGNAAAAAAIDGGGALVMDHDQQAPPVDATAVTMMTAPAAAAAAAVAAARPPPSTSVVADAWAAAGGTGSGATGSGARIGWDAAAGTTGGEDPTDAALAGGSWR